MIASQVIKIDDISANKNISRSANYFHAHVDTRKLLNVRCILIWRVVKKLKCDYEVTEAID